MMNHASIMSPANLNLIKELSKASFETLTTDIFLFKKEYQNIQDFNQLYNPVCEEFYEDNHIQHNPKSKRNSCTLNNWTTLLQISFHKTYIIYTSSCFDFP
jgi:hypothetical protein